MRPTRIQDSWKPNIHINKNIYIHVAFYYIVGLEAKTIKDDGFNII